jgi:23S rRNA (uracil1939-C5)-methyltransferase
MKRTRPQQTSAKPARSELVQIEKPIYGGAFLARVEGKATFVPLTLPGEQARVRIVEEKRSYAAAEVEEIISSSADRVIPECRHFGVCGGCSYQHANYESQLALKQTILRETLERGGVHAPEKIDVLAGQPWRYRNRIRLAFDAAGRVGYRGRRSHAIVPIAECPIAAPVLVKAALSAAETLRNHYPAFRPTELSVFCNPEETQLLAAIFSRDSANRGFDRFAESWNEQVPAMVGAELIAHGSDDAQRAIAHWGARSIVYRAGGLDYQVDNGAFFQVNRWLIDALVDRVTANRRGQLAWDLFAGVGLFARRLADSFEQVIAVESAPGARGALEKNLEHPAGQAVNRDTLAFLYGQGKGPKPDLIVVDPPRAGLGAETSSLLSAIAAPAVVYVSCDPATLARDLRILIDSGYSLASVTLADLFPQTFHLETVVELRRS